MQLDGRKIEMDELTNYINDLQPGTRLTCYSLPEEIYHAAPGLGSTAFKEANKSMAHYKVYRDEPREDKKCYDIGSAVHCLTLEPELFDDRFAVHPEIDRRTKAGKEAWAKFVGQHPGKTYLSEKEIKQVERMADSLLCYAGKYLTGGNPEVSYFYRDHSGLILKARVDYQIADFAVDVKTRRQPIGNEINDFTRFIKYEYDIQDALYRRVSGLNDMIYVGVGKYAPYPVFLRLQGDDVRERAEKKIDNLIKQIKTAEEFDEYPMYPVELVRTELTDFEKKLEEA